MAQPVTGHLRVNGWRRRVDRVLFSRFAITRLAASTLGANYVRETERMQMPFRSSWTPPISLFNSDNHSLIQGQ